MRSHLIVLGAALGLALVMAPAAGAQQVAWEQWQHQVGIVDVGTRADASLVAMAAGRLFTVAPGAITPLVTDFTADPNAEPYFVVVSPLTDEAAGCTWSADDLFILDLTSPPGLARVDGSGHTSHFTTLAGVDTLGGIALDTNGLFDHRLLVTGTHNGNQTTVFAH